MAYDDKGNHWVEDPLLKMRQHNQRTQAAWQRRAERIEELRRGNQIEILPAPPVKGGNLPEVVRGIIGKMRRAPCDFRLLHFTLQFGRLRIEFSQAKGVSK